MKDSVRPLQLCLDRPSLFKLVSLLSSGILSIFGLAELKCIDRFALPIFQDVFDPVAKRIFPNLEDLGCKKRES